MNLSYPNISEFYQKSSCIPPYKTSSQGINEKILTLPEMSVDEYDKQYYFDIAPHYGPHLPVWLELSQAVRQQQMNKCILDIPYGSDVDERLDFFPSESKSQKLSPVVIFFHGGNWRTFSKSEHSFVANKLPNYGVSVIIPDYSLCPKVTLHTIVFQMIQSVRWVYHNADSLGIDKRRIFLSGHSAGGHLAALLTAVAWDKLGGGMIPSDIIKGCLALSGMYDLNPIMHTPILQQVVNFTPEIVNNFSPARICPIDVVNMIVAVGELETPEYHRQTSLLRKVWGNTQVEQMVVANKHHCSLVECLAHDGNEIFTTLLNMIKP